MNTRRSVVFHKPENAGNDAVNIKVDLNYSFPRLGPNAGVIVDVPECVLSFYACILKSSQMKIDAIKELIWEDWKIGVGAIEIANRYMLNH